MIIFVNNSYPFSLIQCNPTDSRTDPINMAASYPTPSLKTISTFSMSAILDEGIALEDHYVGLLTRRERANAIRFSKKCGVSRPMTWRQDRFYFPPRLRGFLFHRTVVEPAHQPIKFLSDASPKAEPIIIPGSCYRTGVVCPYKNAQFAQVRNTLPRTARGRKPAQFSPCQRRSL